MTHDDALLKRSYRSRLAAENNWSDQVHWSTLFTWFANDGGFPGALLLVATFSFIWAVAWRDATLAGNDRAAIVFAFVLQMMFWLPANN